MTDPFTHDVTVRYRDLDTYGHVNNAVFGTYLEEARSAWIEATLDVPDMDAFSTVLAALELEFQSPVVGRGTLTVAVTPSAVGTSSFTLEYRVLQDGELAATGTSTQVHVDPETGEPTPYPNPWRAQMQAAMSE